MQSSGQHHIPAALLPGNNHGDPLNRKVLGRKSRSERFAEEKFFVPPPGLEPLAVEPVPLSWYRQRCSAPSRTIIYLIIRIKSMEE